MKTYSIYLVDEDGETVDYLGTITAKSKKEALWSLSGQYRYTADQYNLVEERG